MNYYAVIDTNVLVSAMLKWNSIPGDVLGLTLDGPIIPLLNKEIVEEYRNVLARPKFHLTEEIIKDVLDGLESKGIFVDAKSLDEQLPDPKDRVFYEVVMEAQDEKNAYLVTGNSKHFPAKPFIVTPRQMLEIIFSEPNEENPLS